jgi:hypothetical protein
MTETRADWNSLVFRYFQFESTARDKGFRTVALDRKNYGLMSLVEIIAQSV